nr:RNA polymerase sigma factor [Winogradskyella pacifica]
MKHVEFKNIYEDNYPKVMRLCLGYCNGNEPQAKDLAQEVFIKVWGNLKTFRQEASLSTWIYRITVNTCLVHIRNSKKTMFSSEMPNPIESKLDDSKEHIESKFKQLYACINKLNVDNKAIILLELEGLQQKEIAEIMGLTHEAIRVRIHRIKNELTKCVKQ